MLIIYTLSQKNTLICWNTACLEGMPSTAFLGTQAVSLVDAEAFIDYKTQEKNNGFARTGEVWHDLHQA